MFGYCLSCWLATMNSKRRDFIVPLRRNEVVSGIYVFWVLIEIKYA
jgi:hypothetical protein